MGLPSRYTAARRHLILHGRSTGYGTAANAVKVLFALDQLASIVRRSVSASLGLEACLTAAVTSADPPSNYLETPGIAPANPG